jgi:hypothetical protein
VAGFPSPQLRAAEPCDMGGLAEPPQQHVHLPVQIYSYDTLYRVSRVTLSLVTYRLATRP